MVLINILGGLTDQNKNNQGSGQTYKYRADRANALADFVVAFSKPGAYSLVYPLSREESLNIDQEFGTRYAQDAIGRMRGV